jgi:orotate phosphoribosyltransferase
MIPDIQSEKSRLLEILKELSYEKRHIVLRCGRESDFYIDCRQAALNAEGAFLCGRVLYQHYKSLGIKVKGIGGPTLGADPLVTAFAIASHEASDPVSAFIIRKESKTHGTREMIEGRKNFRAGDPVLIIEDVLTTGESAIRSFKIAKDQGLDPVHIIVLVDREEGGRENLEKEGIPVSSIYTQRDFI